MDPEELRMHRHQTDAFIRSHPVELVLSRAETTTTDAGGVIEGEPTPMDEAQTFRFLESARVTNLVQQSSVIEGAGVEQLMLIGYWNADIKEGDTFRYGGRPFRVTWVHPEATYRKRANVVIHGD